MSTIPYRFKDEINSLKLNRLAKRTSCGFLAIGRCKQARRENIQKGQQIRRKRAIGPLSPDVVVQIKHDVSITKCAREKV